MADRDLGDVGDYDLTPVEGDPFAADLPKLAPSASTQADVGGSGGAAAGSEALYTLGRPGGGGGATSFRGPPGEAASALPASDPIAAEQARAAAAAGRYSPVNGLPQKPIQLQDGSFYVPGPLEAAHQAAEAYMRESGLPYEPPTEYAKLNKGFATRIAGAFDNMAHDPHDPAVRAAYEALANETLAQYQHVKGTGLKIDYIEPGMPDPYADNPRAAIKDIRDNNHWWVYPTESGYGAEGAAAADENPMLRPSGETISGRPTVINDIFRVVHDYFGHAKEGHGFRAEGEENAYRSHMAMYSPAAIPAATTELRGQNSWLNFGPHGESNRTAKAADTVFADQKIGLMPDWTWKEGAGSPMRPLMAPALVTRPGSGGLLGEEQYIRQARERLEEGLPPTPGEWRGGRIGYQSGGATDDEDPQPAPLGQGGIGSDYKLEAVDHDPFHQLDVMGAQYRQAHPEDYRPAPAPAPTPQSDTWYGRWGQTLGDEVNAGLGALSSAYDWGTKAIGEETARTIADPTGLGYRTVSPQTQKQIAGAVTGGSRELLSDPMLGEGVVTAPHPPEAFAPRAGAAGSQVLESAPRAQIMEVNGVKRHLDPDFPESRIGTSAPWSEPVLSGIDPGVGHPHANNSLSVNMDLAKQTPETLAANARLVTGGLNKKGKPIPTIPYIKGAVDENGNRIDLNKATPEQVHESLQQHMISNIVATHDAVSPDVRPGSKQWYEGANEIARRNAVRTDIPHENSAGVYAALSPQKDWHQNVALGDRVSHIASTTDDATMMSPDMVDWVNRYADRKPVLQDVLDKGGKRVPNTVYREDVLNALADTQGKTWGDMNNTQKAFYTRAFDEAHGPPEHLLPIDEQTGQPSIWQDEKGDWKTGHYIMNPDGTSTGQLARYGDDYPNKVGQPIPVSWGSNGEIEDALKSHYATSMADISDAMGTGHKRRSFYNNIIAPWSRAGDVTGDTHAIAVALLRPLGASSHEVSYGLGQGGSGNAKTGISGLYPDVADAYRRAAKIISDRTPWAEPLLPRELQSITWEAVRGLWSPVEKGKKATIDRVNGLWGDYMAGRKTQAQVQREILGANGQNIDPPNWWGSFRTKNPMDEALEREALERWAGEGGRRWGGRV